MLIEIRVRDYAVIAELALELGRGLNVLSGETGAGKSIIVGALTLVTGGRASADVVRQGCAKAVVEAVFDISSFPDVEDRLEELGLGTEDGILILRREIAAVGRSRAWVNGSPATVATLGGLGAALVDIHGQHEHQSLSRPGPRASLLDACSGGAATAESVRELFREVVRSRDALVRLEQRLEELARRSDYLRFQLGEIEGVAPRAGEDAELRDRARRFEHSEELAHGAATLHHLLYEQDESLTERIAGARTLLSRLSAFDPALADEAARVEEARLALEEVGRTLGDYAANVDHDPAELARLRVRLDELQRIKRKYGPELEDVLRTASTARRELSALDRSDRDLEALREVHREAVSKLGVAAGELTRLRRAGATRLGESVENELPGLGMGNARFRVHLEALDEIGARGAERVDFLASANAGFDPAPINRIASGGELSRIMLALKSVLAEADRTPVLVFDEVDAGIGGTVASRVGERLAGVAGEHQVLVVTHLAQIASKAATHLVVDKSAASGSATVSTRRVLGDDRVAEVARMLGGDPESSASREHARELLGGRRGLDL